MRPRNGFRGVLAALAWLRADRPAGDAWQPDEPAGSFPGGPRGPGPRAFGLARAQAYIFVAAGICGFVVIAFPHPEVVHELAAIPVALVAIAAGAVLYAVARSVPEWVLLVNPAFGTLLASAAVVLSESAISAYTLFYLWIGFYCSYFLAPGQAIAQLAFIALNFAAMLVLVGTPHPPPANADVSYLVLATATMVAAGVLMLYLRSRVEKLVGELSGATRTDPLTGLPNRRAFREALEDELERARPSRRPVSVLAGDVDRLRALNDRLGHDEADRILVAIARLIDEETRRIDTIARIGPGGFGVILPELGEGEAYRTAEDLLTRIRRTLRADASPVTISFGVAAYPRRAADADQLLRAADRALFTAKVLGRDRAVLFSPEVEELLRGSPRRHPGEAISHLKTLLSLAEALDLRDRRTALHSQTVGSLAERIARELGMPESRVARVRIAGILHDIGKVGVPDAVLFKDGALEPEEWEQMKRHPEIGARILGSSEFADIREWILSSHEQPDGRGYPRGRSGDAIPIESRILCVADAYEAMVSDRIYRPALGEDAARIELRRGAGSEYDAEVVEALFAVLDRAPASRAPSKRATHTA